MNVFNTDGWTNILASMGLGKDRKSNTKFKGGATIDRETLDSLYRKSGIARRIIDLPVHEMTREWIEIEGDTSKKLKDKFEELGVKSIMKDTLRWGRLYGGALVIMGIEDGGSLDMPIRENNIRDLNFLRVYDRHQVSWTSSDINCDPYSEFYGLSEYYTINAYTTGKTFRVHASRVLRHDGAKIPERERYKNNGWGDSVLEAVFSEMQDYGIIKSSSVNIVQDFVQTILQIDNLAGLLADGKDDLIKKRLEIIDLSRSVANTVLLDGKETYAKHSSTVTGLDSLIDRFALALCAVTGIPATRFFGQAPAGLNSTGESDIRNFYDELKGDQEEEMLPMLKRLAQIITGKNDVIIHFNSLWQMTDQQEADWKYKIAQTDEIYAKNAIVSPEEIAVSRFGKGFSSETSIGQHE